VKKFILLAILMCCPLLLAAQDQPEQTPAPASSAPGADASQDATGTPEDAQKAEHFTIFGETFGRSNFSAELNFRQEYDDNVLTSSLFRFSDNVSHFGGRFSVASEGRKYRLQLHYSPEGRIYNRFSQRNGFSQNFASGWEYQIGRHTSLNWNSTLIDTSTSAHSPFGFVAIGNVIVPAFFPQGLENNLRVLHSSANLGLEHRSSARTTWKFGVNGGTANFFELDGNTPALSRSNEGFNAGVKFGVDHAINRSVRLGVELTQSYFGFLDPSTHLNYQTAKLTYEQKLRNGMLIRFGVGPSLQERQNASDDVATGVAVDASVSRQLRRTSFGVQYRRGNQLGLAQGSLATDQAAFFLNHGLGRKWLVGGSFTFSRTESITGATTGTFDAFGVNPTVGYQITRDLRAQAAYWFSKQTGGTGVLSLNNFDRNVYSVSLIYSLNSLFRR